MRRTVSVCLSFSVLFLSITGESQLTLAADLGSTANSGDSTSQQLEEVVVTAQKRQERLQDVPISLSVVSGADLDQSTYAGINDALNTVPGIAAFKNSQQQTGTLLSFRGVSAAGALASGASTVAYYVDSVPFGMIRTALVPDPDVYDLQRIEVLRGPQGTLYGANALNGVVRVITNDPDLERFDFKARAFTSTTDGGGVNYGGDFAANVPIVDNVLGARFTLSDEQDSGWVNSALATHVNDGQMLNARLKLAYHPIENLTVDLSAWHSQQSAGAPSSGDSNYNNQSSLPQPLETKFDAYGARITYEFPSATLSSMTSYVNYRNDNLFDYSPAFNAPYEADTNLTSRVFAEELNVASRNTGPWTWSAGAMFRDDRDTTFQDLLYPSPVPVLYPQPYWLRAPLDDFADTSRSWAGFGELGRRFAEGKLGVTVGLRYFHDSQGTEPVAPGTGPVPPPNAITQATSSAATPRATLSWYAAQNLTAYASYSQGFRSGVPQDELVGSAYPPLKPDRLHNYEVGAKGSLFDGKLVYEADAFYTRWIDIQQSIDVPINNINVLVLTNAGDASGEGVEFSVTGRPISPLSITATFGWNNLHFTETILSGGAVVFPEGSRPNISPEYTGGLAAKYSIPLGASGNKFVISAAGNYISPLNTTYLTAGTVESNSYLVTRASLGLETRDHWVVNLFVDNANNYNGSQQPNPFLPQWDTRIQPRTFGVQLNYRLAP